MFTRHMDFALKRAVATQPEITAEVPVGATIVYRGRELCSFGNQVIALTDPTAHAEILAIRQAAKLLNTVFLIDCDIYVTLEPCAMCAQAIALARIRRLFFGAYNEKGGGVENGARVLDRASYPLEIYGGIREEECAELMKKFFQNLSSRIKPGPEHS